MRKLSSGLLRPLLLLCLLLKLVSCSKQENDAPNEVKLLNEVKAWYMQSPHITGELDWVEARISIDLVSRKSKIEVPYRLNRPFEKGGKGIRKIIFTKDKGIIVGTMFVIVATKEYAKLHAGFNARDFTGLIGEYDLNMKFMHGEYYEDGIRKRKAEFVSYSSKRAFLSEVRTERECQYLQDTYVDADGVFTVYGYSVCTDDQGNSTPNTGAGSGVGVGGGGGGGTGGGAGPHQDEHWDIDEVPPPVINQGASFDSLRIELVSPCLIEATRLAIKNDFQNAVLKTFNHFFISQSEVDVYIGEAPLSSSLYGKTSGSIYNIEITLNTNLLAHASKELIIATLYHEMIHALFDARKTQTNDPLKWGEAFQHTIMAATYVDQMSSSLRQIFPSLSKDDADALSWGGLEETNAWKLMDPKIANEILLKADQFDQTHKAGTRCP